MLPDVVTTANEEHRMGIKRVTTIRTVCDVFNKCRFPKTMLGEVDHLLHLYLTIPLTSATAERTFSTLRRLKSYLRSTMTQKRLNHVILLHTYKKNVDQMNLYQIAQDLFPETVDELIFLVISKFFVHYSNIILRYYMCTVSCVVVITLYFLSP